VKFDKNELYYTIMEKIKYFGLLAFIFIINQSFSDYNNPKSDNTEEEIINKWQPFKTIEENGLLGKRMDLWRAKRLWFVTDTGFLLSGFESRPGSHLWQGEHDREWIAFSYGPLTLAEKISEKPAEEPFAGLDTTLVTRKEIQSMREKCRFCLPVKEKIHSNIPLEIFKKCGLIFKESLR